MKFSFETLNHHLDIDIFSKILGYRPRGSPGD